MILCVENTNIGKIAKGYEELNINDENADIEILILKVWWKYLVLSMKRWWTIWNV